MNWKSEENGRKDEITRRDTHPNATQQTQTTEEQRAEPNQEADLSVPTRTAILLSPSPGTFWICETMKRKMSCG
jgi:biotin carboxyl carrier protein